MDSHYRVDPQYFDYVVVPHPSLIALLSDKFPALEAPDSIEFTFEQPLWKNTGIFFPHRFRLDGMNGAFDLERTFKESAEAVSHLRRKFLDLERGIKKLIFVVSNSQHNLARYCHRPAEFHATFGLDRAKVQSIVTALENRYADRFRLLLVMESSMTPDWRWDRPKVLRVKSQSVRLAAGMEWKGDDAQWETALEKALSFCLTAQRHP